MSHQVFYVFSPGDFVITNTGEVGPVMRAATEGETNYYHVDLLRGRLWFQESSLALTELRPVQPGEKWERPLNLRENLLTEHEYDALGKLYRDAIAWHDQVERDAFTAEFLTSLHSAMGKLVKLTTKG